MPSRRQMLAALGLISIGVVTWWATTRVPIPEIPTAPIAATADAATVAHLAEARLGVEASLRSSEAWGNYGLVLQAYEQSAEAVICLKVAVALDPAEGRWAYYLGQIVGDSDPVAASDWLRQALAAELPEEFQPPARATLAESLLAQNQPQTALDSLGPTPQSPHERLVFARACMKLGDDRRAAEQLRALATEFPTRTVLALQAQLFQKQGRTASAAEVSRRLTTAPDPAWPDPLRETLTELNRSRAGRLDLAAKRLRERQPAEAEAILMLLLAGSQDAKPHLGLAEARLMRGDRAGAMVALQEARQIDPGDATVHYQLGQMRFTEGETLWNANQRNRARPAFQVALGHLEAALAINPQFVKALLLKGVALTHFLDRRSEGILHLRRVVELRPELADGHLYLGEALRDIGNREAAQKELRRAQELALPGDSRAVEALKSIGNSG